MSWPDAFYAVGGLGVIFGGYVVMEIARQRALIRIAELAAESERRAVLKERDNG